MTSTSSIASDDQSKKGEKKKKPPTAKETKIKKVKTAPSKLAGLIATKTASQQKSIVSDVTTRLSK